MINNSLRNKDMATICLEERKVMLSLLLPSQLVRWLRRIPVGTTAVVVLMEYSPLVRYLCSVSLAWEVEASCQAPQEFLV